MAKKRSKESYYGNTEETIRRQRSGLIPGGDLYRKREISEARYNCFWEYVGLEDKQSICRGCLNFDNLKDFKAIHKKELESEKWIDNWWVKLELGFKKDIYKIMMEILTEEEKISIYKQIEECLEKKLAIMKKG